MQRQIVVTNPETQSDTVEKLKQSHALREAIQKMLDEAAGAGGPAY